MYQPLIKHLQRMEAREMEAAQRFRDSVDAQAEREATALHRQREYISVNCPNHIHWERGKEQNLLHLLGINDRGEIVIR